MRSKSLVKSAGKYWNLTALAVGLVVILIASVIIHIWAVNNSYKLSSSIQAIIGKPDPKLLKDLTYNSQSKSYYLNKSLIGDSNSNAPSAVGQRLGKYSFKLSSNASGGVDIYDDTAGDSISLVPEFTSNNAKYVDNHIVYPINNGQLIYTAENNGLREDIAYSHAPSSSSINFKYKLNLSNKLVARQLPSGAIGMYSTNPNQPSSPAKDYLVFALPAPIVEKSVNSTSSPKGVSTKFSLNGDQLAMTVSGLNHIEGPFSIDPSILVPSATPYTTNGNNEGDVSVNSSGTSISESGLVGGTLGSWTTDTSEPLPTATYYATSVTYNSYVYEIGGYNGTSGVTTVDYAPINSNGSLGSWTATTSLPTATYYATSVAYNGYVYEIGGYTGSNTTTVDYAPINSNGSLGSWTATSTLPTATRYATSEVYNGYVYEVGGYTSASTATVDYAPINSNGTLGSWTATTSLPGAVYNATSVIYNGYIYNIGGTGSATTVNYAPINSNGTLGSWTATTTLPYNPILATAVVYDGYVYEIGGYTGTVQSTVYYAPINSNGTLGSWTATTSLPTGTSYATSVAYNGYVYEIGGFNSVSSTAVVDYSQIEPAGYIGSWPTATSLLNATSAATSVAYNGYVYEIGGTTTSATTAVDYDNINSNGTLGGTWNSATSLPIATSSANSVAYNGYVYEIGGFTTVGVTSVYYDNINSNGTLGGTWNSATSLPNTTYKSTSVVYNGYIYVIGGIVNGSFSSSVEYAAINSNGTLGSWNTTSSLSTGIEYATSSEYDGYVYLMGGISTTQSNGVSTVYYAPINSNGTLGTWNSTTSLPQISYNNSSVAYNGYVYEIGGYEVGGNWLQAVDYAPISSNGTLGSWTATTNLPAGTSNATSAIYNGFVYLLGGTSNYNTVATVYYAQINNGGPGILNSWASTSSLLAATDIFTTVAYNGYVYEIGGYNGTTGVTTVDYAPINNGGGIGTWTATTSLPTTTYNATSVVYNGYIYEIGGTSSNGAAVYYAPISSNGTLGSWTATTSLPAATVGASSVVYNGYIYEIGGYTSSATTTVDYAPISSNGTLGSWTATTSLPAGVNGASSVVYNGYVYEIGGYNGSSGVTTVDYAPISSNGTLGSWTATTSLPTTTYNATSVVYNGYIYEIGGNNGSGSITTVDYAPINTAGEIGPWTPTTSLGTAISQASAIAYQGIVYSLGGLNGSSTVVGTVNYVSLQSIPRVGYYSMLVDLSGSSSEDPTPVEIMNTGTDSGNPGIGGQSGLGGVGVEYAFATNACSTFNAESLLSIGINLLNSPYAISYSQNGCSVTTKQARYVWLRFILDDSQTASFPDVNGNHTSLTGTTIYYDAATNGRLRGGATFSSGSLQSLNALPTPASP